MENSIGVLQSGGTLKWTPRTTRSQMQRKGKRGPIDPGGAKGQVRTWES